MTVSPEHYLKRELYDLVQKDGRIFEFLQAGSLDGLWFWDVERPNEEWMSVRFKEVFGYTDDEIPNTSAWWLEHIFPEDLQPLLENFRLHCADPAHPYDQMVRYRHKNESTVWIRCRGIAIRDAQGKAIRMLGAHTDVTGVIQAQELKHRQTAAKDSEMKYKRIAESLPQLVWTCEPDGSCDYLSKQWLDYTGVPEAAQTGTGWLQQVHPEDRDRLRDIWQAAFTQGVLFQVEFRLCRHDGIYRWFDTRAVPFRDAEGKIVKWFGTNTDVQPQHEAGAALKESEERLQTIIANLNAGLVISDLQGNFLHWNPASLAMHGVTEGATWCRHLTDYQSLYELSGPAGTALSVEQCPLPRVLQGERLSRYEVRIRRRETDWERTFSYGGSIVQEPGGRKLAFLTITDVTERSQAEAMVNGQKQILEMVALGQPLLKILDTLLRFLERQSRGMLCSILLLDEDGVHVRHGAAPSLPEEFSRAIDGAPIGPSAGSCGTAAFRREPVLVSDIASDPLWADYRHLALPHGLKACWSTPIFDPHRRVLGTFAIYYRQLGLPNDRHRELIAFATHTAAICINRQRAESSLRLSEARYALAARGTSDGLWDWNIRTGDDYLSPRWKELLGFADDELPNKADSFFGRIHPDDVPHAVAAVRAHLDQRIPYDVELSLRTKSGEYRSFQSRGQAEWDEQGRPLRMAGSITDITERKKAKQALRDAAEFNRQIIACADDGIVVLDRDLRYTVWNHFMERLMGLKASEVLGRTSEELFPWVRRGGQLAAMKQVLTGASVMLPDSMRIKTGSQQLYWVQARLSALRNAQGEIIGVIATIIDVTERKQAEQELRRSHEQLRALTARLQLVREEQSAHIAREIHDVLGQQLTALKLDLMWLKRRVGTITDPTLQTSLTNKLTASAGLVDTTIQTVQKVATELRPGLLDKLGLAAALEHEARDFAERSGLRCELEIDKEPVHLEQNRAIDIFRVCQEMLTNVARHAQASHVKVKLVRDQGQLVLEVSDNGRGITGQQVGATKSLGLLGMTERAQILGGRLDILGSPGQGTRAVLTVPLPPAP